MHAVRLNSRTGTEGNIQHLVPPTQHTPACDRVMHYQFTDNLHTPGTTMHWIIPVWGLSTDWGLSYRPLHQQSPQRRKKDRRLWTASRYLQNVLAGSRQPACRHLWAVLVCRMASRRLWVAPEGFWMALRLSRTGRYSTSLCFENYRDVDYLHSWAECERWLKTGLSLLLPGWPNWDHSVICYQI